MSLVGKHVEIKSMDRKYSEKVYYEGTVKILDKVMMDKARYSKSAVINNASLDVFIGMGDGDEVLLFLPEEITQIKSYL